MTNSTRSLSPVLSDESWEYLLLIDRITISILENVQSLSIHLVPSHHHYSEVFPTMAARAILITGATGKQGGAVINALLKRKTDFEILALTRNPQSPSAQRLARKHPNIKLLDGNLDAIDDVFRKARETTKLPIWGVFNVQVCPQSYAEKRFNADHPGFNGR